MRGRTHERTYAQDFMLIAVNFHYIRPSFEAAFPSIFGVTPEQFRSQLEALAREGTFVSAENILSALNGERQLPARSIVITFDDGLREQHDVAWPILREMGIPAIFFANTLPVAEAGVCLVHKIHLLRSRIAPEELRRSIEEGSDALGLERRDVELERARSVYKYDEPAVARLKFLLNFVLPAEALDTIVSNLFESISGLEEGAVSRDLYMGIPELRAMAADGLIGTHGHRHLPLGRLAPEAIRDDLGRSMDHLEEWTGQRPFCMSYPYGSIDACADPAGPIAAELGLGFGFTMERSANADLQAPLHLARYACNDVPGGSQPLFEAGTLFDRTPLRSARYDVAGVR